MVCDFPHISVPIFDSVFGNVLLLVADLPGVPTTFRLFGLTSSMELELLLMLAFISTFVSRALIVLSAHIQIEVSTDSL